MSAGGDDGGGGGGGGGSKDCTVFQLSGERSFVSVLVSAWFGPDAGNPTDDEEHFKFLVPLEAFKDLCATAGLKTGNELPNMVVRCDYATDDLGLAESHEHELVNLVLPAQHDTSTGNLLKGLMFYEATEAVDLPVTVVAFARFQVFAVTDESYLMPQDLFAGCDNESEGIAGDDSDFEAPAADSDSEDEAPAADDEEEDEAPAADSDSEDEAPAADDEEEDEAEPPAGNGGAGAERHPRPDSAGGDRKRVRKEDQ